MGQSQCRRWTTQGTHRTPTRTSSHCSRSSRRRRLRNPDRTSRGRSRARRRHRAGRPSPPGRWIARRSASGVDRRFDSPRAPSGHPAADPERPFHRQTRRGRHKPRSAHARTRFASTPFSFELERREFITLSVPPPRPWTTRAGTSAGLYRPKFTLGAACDVGGAS